MTKPTPLRSMKRMHLGKALAEAMEPRERAVARKLHEQYDSRLRAVGYIKSVLECSLTDAIDADDYLSHTAE